MAVGMAVRLAAIPLEVMLVLVMLVVLVFVHVRHRLVRMLVLMALGKVQPHAKRHQGRRYPECGACLLA